MPKRPLRVLVCAAHSLFRDTTIEMLRSMGHCATTADDARAALVLLESQPTDILLTESELQDMPGSTLAEHAISRVPTLAVIFATGQVTEPSAPANMRARTLVSPFSFDALATAIASVETARD
jgi:DNA-binding NtrC family response regulator